MCTSLLPDLEKPVIRLEKLRGQFSLPPWPSSFSAASRGEYFASFFPPVSGGSIRSSARLHLSAFRFLPPPHFFPEPRHHVQISGISRAPTLFFYFLSGRVEVGLHFLFLSPFPRPDHLCRKGPAISCSSLVGSGPCALTGPVFPFLLSSIRIGQ